MPGMLSVKATLVPPAGCDEILLIGDSGAFSGMLANGSPGYDPEIDVENSSCLEYAADHPTVSLQYTRIARDRLAYGLQAPTVNSLGGIGPGITFMRDHFLPNRLTSGKVVRITACAVSGTGLNSGYWASGGAGVVDAKTRINNAIAGNANNAIKVILVCMGANDAIAGMSQSAFTTAFQGMVTYLRANITGATDCPVLVQPLVPAWVATNVATFGPVDAALAALPQNVSKCGYVDPAGTGLSGNIVGQTAIPYHLTAASQRLIGNPGFANAWANLSA